MPPSDTAPPTGAVESMLDRPLAQAVRFVAQSVATWLRALADPWRFGAAAAEGSTKLAPPFAYLVLSMFFAGVTMRMWRSMAALPPSADGSLLTDFRTALGDVSLTQAVLVTLPCVLIVAAVGRLLSLIFRGRDRMDHDRVVVSVCYAAGWQAGIVAMIAALFIAMQTAGLEPAGQLNDEVNDLFPFVALWMLTWGVLIVTPSLTRRYAQRRWWTGPACLSASAIAMPAVLFGSMAALTVSYDLEAATRLKRQRQDDLWIGDLQAYVVTSSPLPAQRGDTGPRSVMTVACVNRCDRLLVVTPQKRLVNPDGTDPRWLSAPLEIVGSSLEELPGEALPVEPGQTRFLRLTVVASGPASAPRHSVPYGVAYHRQEEGGTFETDETSLWAPKSLFPRRLADAEGIVPPAVKQR